MIFGHLELEAIVQVNDRTRLGATKSFITNDESAISTIEIEPETGAGFIGVTGYSINDAFLDWQYSSDGVKTVSLRITTSGAPVVFTSTITAITSADDKLWSSDQDLTAIEPDILKWVPAGKNTFLNVHRKVQNLILDWFDEVRLYDKDGERLTKDSIIATEDLKRLSTYWTLAVIFEGISNKPDDVFAAKSKNYMDQVYSAKERNRIRYDFNNDSTQGSNEGFDFRSATLVRR